MVKDIEDTSTKKKVWPAIETTMGQAKKMQAELVEKVVKAAKGGANSISDLDDFVRSMKPSTARYYFQPVVREVSQRLKSERGPKAAPLHSPARA